MFLFLIFLLMFPIHLLRITVNIYLSSSCFLAMFYFTSFSISFLKFIMLTCHKPPLLSIRLSAAIRTGLFLFYLIYLSFTLSFLDFFFVLPSPLPPLLLPLFALLLLYFTNSLIFRFYVFQHILFLDFFFYTY